MSTKIRLSRMAPLVLLACLLLPHSVAEEPQTPDLTFYLVEKVFPHIAIGGPWSTTLTFINVGGQSTQFTLRFFQPNGQPWTVTTSTGVTASVFTANLGSVSANDTSGFAASLDVELPSTGGLVQTGWAEIEHPTGTFIGGHAVFRDNGGPGRPIPFEAVVPLSTFADGDTKLLTGFRTALLPFDQTRGYNTCVALVNSSPVTTSIVSLIMSSPNAPTSQLGSDVVLPPRNQTSFCLRDRFPQTESRKGIVVIARREAELWLTILGFRFDPQGAFTTFFPMSQL